MLDARIAFLSAYDPLDVKQWSGTPLRVLTALKQHFRAVIPLGPYSPIAQTIGRAKSAVSSRIMRKRYNYVHSQQLSMAYGRHFSSKLKQGRFDLVFACSASPELAYLDTALPVIYMADATFENLRDYYPACTGLSPANVRESHETERRALLRADACVLTSDWAAQTAVEFYRADPARVHVVPLGANLTQSPDIVAMPHKDAAEPFHILFLGVDWRRKGGPLAWETFQTLIGRGRNVKMTVCGCIPPEEVAHPSLTVIPFLNKGDPGQYGEFVKLMSSADLLLLPTRADCTPVVFAEASAYGMPSLSTRTGGVSTMVKEGENGFTLPPDARGDAYAARVEALLDTPDAYRALRVSARRYFDEVVNWDAWGSRVTSIAKELIWKPSLRDLLNLQSVVLAGKSDPANRPFPPPATQESATVRCAI